MKTSRLAQLALSDQDAQLNQSSLLILGLYPPKKKSFPSKCLLTVPLEAPSIQATSFVKMLPPGSLFFLTTLCSLAVVDSTTTGENTGYSPYPHPLFYKLYKVTPQSFILQEKRRKSLFSLSSSKNLPDPEVFLVLFPI